VNEWDIIAVCASMLLAAAAVVLGLLGLARARSSRSGPRAAGDSARAAEACNDVRDLMAQLDRLAAQLEGRLDACLEKVRAASAEADAKIARLQELGEGAAGEPTGRPKRPIKISEAAGLEVMRLSRTGMDPVEIARQLKVDVGEVELVLSLQRAQRVKQA
jgi:outer membrane murein-binding lipoprotein Lpp